MKKQYNDYAISTRSKRVYSIKEHSYTSALGLLSVLYGVNEIDVMTIERGEIVK